MAAVDEAGLSTAARDALDAFKAEARDFCMKEIGTKKPVSAMLAGVILLLAVAVFRFVDQRLAQEIDRGLKLDERLKAFEDHKLETFQRQLSRHADHLARLESWKQGR